MLDLLKKEEADILEQMHALNRGASGISWSAAVRKDDKLQFIAMNNRPCYGEMRAYGKDSTRPQDHKPGDLPRPIPPGIREAVGCYFGSTSPSAENHNRLIRYVLSDKSPWRRGLDQRGIHLTWDGDETHHIKGVVLTETEVDPTVMVSLFMVLRSARYSNWGDSVANRFCTFVDEHKMSEAAALAACFWVNISLTSKTFVPSFGFSYFLANKLDPKKFATGEPLSLSNGRTWRDGEDYNRPEIQDLFKDETLPFFTTDLSQKTGISVSTYQDVGFDKVPAALEYIEQRFSEAA